jgi:hypothetical protein
MKGALLEKSAGGLMARSCMETDFHSTLIACDGCQQKLCISLHRAYWRSLLAAVARIANGDHAKAKSCGLLVEP